MFTIFVTIWCLPSYVYHLKYLMFTILWLPSYVYHPILFMYQLMFRYHLMFTYYLILKYNSNFTIFYLRPFFILTILCLPYHVIFCLSTISCIQSYVYHFMFMYHLLFIIFCLPSYVYVQSYVYHLMFTILFYDYN